jgi:hypothetical protein
LWIKKFVSIFVHKPVKTGQSEPPAQKTGDLITWILKKEGAGLKAAGSLGVIISSKVE